VRIKPLSLLLIILGILTLLILPTTSYSLFFIFLAVSLGLWFGYQYRSTNQPDPWTVISMLIFAFIFILIYGATELIKGHHVNLCLGSNYDLEVYADDIHSGEFFVEIQVTKRILSELHSFATPVNSAASTQFPTPTPTLTPTPIPTMVVDGQPAGPLVKVVHIDLAGGCSSADVEIQDLPAQSFLSAQDGSDLEVDPPHLDKQNIRWSDGDLADGIEFAYVTPPLQYLRPIIAPLFDITSFSNWVLIIIGGAIGSVISFFVGRIVKRLKDKFLPESTKDAGDNDDEDKFDLEVVKR